MKISEFSVKRPVTILMILLVILLVGAAALISLKVDLYPEMDLPVAAAIASYSGAAPEEMEELITKPMEDQLSTVHDIDSIQSMSSRGSSIVIVQFKYGTDMDNATLEMREKVEMAQMSFPDDVEKPTVMKIDLNMFPVMAIGLEGDMPVNEMKTIAENEIQNKLERVKGVASTEIMGGLDDEIKVSVDPQVLQAYGLSINSLVTALQSENRNVSAGDVDAGNKQYMIRVLGEFEDVDQIGDVNITTPSGVSFKLRDIADIEQGFADSNGYVKIDGVEGIALTVNKQSDGNTVEVSQNVNKAIEEINKEIPGIRMKTLYDQAEFIQDAIGNIVKDVIIGAILAVLILLIFLRNIRSTVIISLVIPISLIGTFAAMYLQGTTLNMMTLGGLALVAGNMVDNAVVLLDNIFRHRQAGEGMVEAAVKGSNEMTNAITASTLTQVSVFAPIIFVGGLAAELFSPMAITVTTAQIISLVVSIIMIPLLCSKFLKVEQAYMDRDEKSIIRRVAEKSESTFNAVESKYRNILQWAITHRKTVILVTAGLLVASVALIPLVGMELLPETDQGSFTVDIELDKGAKLEETTKVVEQVEKIIDAQPEVETVFVNVGSGLTSFSGGGSETASFTVENVALSERERSTGEIAQAVRQEVEKIPGADIKVTVSSMTSMGGSSSGNPIEIQVRGEDLDQLSALADEIVGVVEKVEGTQEVESNLEGGAPEVTLVVDRSKLSAYGLTPTGVANSVQASVMGTVATRYRTGDDEIDVRVRFPESVREKLSDINSLSITTPSGAQVPLSELGKMEIAEGPTTINRLDQERVVTVSSNLFDRDLGSVMQDIQAKVDNEIVLPSGYSIDYGGESEQMMEAFGSLGYAIIFAVILVYMVLAAQFESLLYPFIIMFSVPLLLVGVVFGLLVTGRTISITALIGVITLVGIVVNNGIVLVDWINQLRGGGMDREEAIVQAGPHRLRAILMTALTTGLAMVPMALGIGEGAEMQAPMGTVVVFGLFASTVLTLVVVPVMYIVLDNMGIKFKKKFWSRGDKNKDSNLEISG